MSDLWRDRTLMEGAGLNIVDGVAITATAMVWIAGMFPQVVLVVLLLLPCSASPTTALTPFRQPLSIKASSSSPLPSHNPTALTFNVCGNRQPCVRPRECRRWASITGGRECGLDWLCVCFPLEPTECTSSTECVSGEVCAESLYSEHALCVSSGVSFSFFAKLPEPTEGVSPSPSPAPRQGFTFDPCHDDADCKDDRGCVHYGFFGNETTLCDGRKPCFCSPEELYPCFDPSDCEIGEVCADVHPAVTATCMSEQAVGVFVKPVQFTAQSSSTGVNFDSCHTSDDCRGTRVCAQFKQFPPDLMECGGNRPCVCLPRSGILCEETRDCDEGEVCSKFVLFSGLVCVSQHYEKTFGSANEISAGTTPTPVSRPQPSPSSSNSPGAIPSSGAGRSPGGSDACVDARVLQHLPPDELAFRNSVWTKALCDGNDNCATEGHVIVFNGLPMMMRSYCRLTTCFEKEMYVNSPKYRVGLRVDSNTQELQYTAFAARHQTRAEERLLRVAVHVGL